MTHSLPAILIGGPPHAGKSVLFYSITSALNKRNIPHHAIRACPDGEGNWSQEGDEKTVSHVRDENKGKWSDEFVERICQNLDHRCFPFLVDMGAYPTPSQHTMLKRCTHAILLLRADRPESTEFWQALVAENKLTLIEQIYSQRQNDDATFAIPNPIIEATLSGLERYERRMAQGPTFERLVEHIINIFSTCMPQNLEAFYRGHAPTQLLDLYNTVPQQERWTPSALQPFLMTVPTQAALSIYGKAPGWVYAAIATANENPQLSQFDPRFHNGWVQSLMVQFGEDQCPDIEAKLERYDDIALLRINIPSKHLEYLQTEPLSFPSLSPGTGLIIYGVVPYWLLTALVRLYKKAGAPWIGYYYVQEGKAVVSYSSHPSYVVGDLVTLPSGTQALI